MGYQWIRAHENRDNQQSKVFDRLPTYQQVFSLIEPMVESLQQHGAVVTVELFANLIDEQYLAGPDCYADNPARWAIVNSFFATAMLNRSTTSFLKEITPTAWNYFKIAFSMFPELITRAERNFFLSLDPIAAQRHRRVFRVAYILDVDAVDKYDLSSTSQLKS
ncbi:hypothetical protein INS49_004166 [Diaporthe citri]|uniref:uncharacterized protein n=1 Tax=Diaporthe citri TaxID=83186 RepID=UPI001C80D278|nr:uncharacterized protein INS49_004166 [Diaporthe citri]KAG6355085.1 hypothetical protein INS49_004166 [Diaporthe citri]